MKSESSFDNIGTMHREREVIPGDTRLGSEGLPKILKGDYM